MKRFVKAILTFFTSCGWYGPEEDNAHRQTDFLLKSDLEFIADPNPDNEMKMWCVESNNVPIGSIRWYPEQRKYAFQPFESVSLDGGSLCEIAGFCECVTYQNAHA
jgi:hypothetical protein